MPFNDLKEFLNLLTEQGELHEIDVEVDPDWEVGAICREVFDRKGPALKFNKVGKWRTPLIVGAYATRKRYGMALGVSSDISEIRARWSKAYEQPIKPVEVNRAHAPCKLIIRNDVNLYKDPFPVPKWHKYDSNPYLGTLHVVITRDPETGWVNLGTYRNELTASNKLGLLTIPYRHVGLHWEKWRQLGKPMPIAIAIGLEPYLNLVGVSAVPAGVDEYDIAGGLKGEPIQVTQAETCDLPVPANAQIVLEGEVPTDDFLPTEGPFGEFPGYNTGVVNNCQYIRVMAVTHQEQPYFQGTPPMSPPTEDTTLRCMGRSFALHNHLVKCGLTGIKDVCVTEGGCAGFHAVVAIRKSYPGHVRDVMGMVWSQPTLFIKHCIVVDEDIDPWNGAKVEWAISSNVRAGRDIEIVKDGKGTSLDPSVPSPGGGEHGSMLTDLLGIDATRPTEAYKAAGEAYPHSADPPKEWVKEVRRKWAEYGF